MSREKDRDEFQDSTTDFFLKVVQKNKEKEKRNQKDNFAKENINITKNKTINRFTRFYNYINRFIDRILSSTISVMILSLIMAVLLFVSVSGGNILTSPTSGTTLENVPLQVEGLSKDLEVTGLMKNVQIGLIGPSLDIYSTKLSSSYEAFIDLQGLTKGEYTVPIKTRNFDDTLTVMIVPDSLKVKIQPKVSNTFNLEYQFENEDKLDQMYSVSVQEMSREKVTIRASIDTINTIDKVCACIDVSNKTSAFEQEAPIKAYDKNGNILDIDISPSTVLVKCNIASYSKDVIVKANFVGNLKSGYQISNYTLSESTVKIYGLKEDISNISIAYVDVDINGLDETKSFNNLPLRKEMGINKFSSETISMTIEVDKIISKTFDKIPIQVLNLSTKRKVSFVGQSKYAKVSIRGNEKIVSSLTNDNIQASIDVNRLSIGTKTVNVKVAVDNENLEIKLLSSTKVTINIERK